MLYVCVYLYTQVKVCFVAKLTTTEYIHKFLKSFMQTCEEHRNKVSMIDDIHTHIHIHTHTPWFRHAKSSATKQA